LIGESVVLKDLIIVLFRPVSRDGWEVKFEACGAEDMVRELAVPFQELKEFQTLLAVKV